MIGISPSTPIYLYSSPTDMRKSFDGLCGLVINFMGKRPENGNLFVFVNRQRNRMKILFWDRHGFWLFYKRLESGRFQLPAAQNGISDISISYEQLLMIIEGIDFSSIKRKKRFRKKVA